MIINLPPAWSFPCLQLTRPVVFPEADMRTLNTLNSALLKFGVVKARADRDVSSQPFRDADQQE